MTGWQVAAAAFVIIGVLVLHALDRLSKQLDKLLSEVSRMRTSTADALWATSTDRDMPRLEQVADELMAVRSDLAGAIKAANPSARHDV